MRLIIFDCDGTLVDSQQLICLAMNAAFERVGLPVPTRDDVRSVIGLSLQNAIAKCLPDGSQVDTAHMSELYKDAFSQLRMSAENEELLYDGVRTTLEMFSNEPKTLMAVATGKSMRGMKRLIAREGFEPYFQSVQTADDHPSKPHPSMISRAMALAGVEPSQTVMVGDTTYDMEMARNAGVSGVGVSWGYHDGRALKESGAHRLIHRFEDLPHVVHSLLEARDAS